MICIETMTDLAEAALAVEAARSGGARLPGGGDDDLRPDAARLLHHHGRRRGAAAAGLEEAGADIVGSNCGNGMEDMVEIAREFGRASSPALVAMRCFVVVP